MPGWFQKLRGRSSAPPRVATDTSPKGVYSALRHQALSTQRSQVGIPEPPIEAPVWGILMETGFDTATASLLALSEGTTSLYFSNGGGVLGGHAHESVRRANAGFILVANQFQKHFRSCDVTPIPDVGHTHFYALTDTGVLTAGALESDLGKGDHSLSPLFYAGQEVITQLRLVSEVQP